MTDAPQDKKSQREKFIETARAIGCDEDEDAFKERLKTLVTAPHIAPKDAESSKGKKPKK
jgi:hypothetical protein